MGLASIISFGTAGYPEKVARRLRIINIICWVTALFLIGIAFRRFLDPATHRWAFEALAVATLCAAIPLLHRFGSAAALVTLILLAFADTWRVTLDGGTAGGYWLATFLGSAFAILLLGAERWLLSAAIALLSGATAIALLLLVPAATGDQPPDDQFTFLLVNVGRTHVLLFAVVFYGAWQIARAEAAVEVERDRSDALLVNMLPAAVADRLKLEPEKKVADRYDAASILFADMAGFTRLTETMTPEALVRFLDSVFSAFDRLVEVHGLEKIKTSGDAYMVVSGVPVPRADHAQALAALACDMLAEAERFEHGVRIRIGIASGPIVAGVVGSRKFFYDVWGDAVNLAARMEQTGVEGRIHVTRETADLLADAYTLEPRGAIRVKGKGDMETFLLRYGR